MVLITIVTGAFVNQLITGGPHIAIFEGTVSLRHVASSGGRLIVAQLSGPCDGSGNEDGAAMVVTQGLWRWRRPDPRQQI